MFTTDGVTRSTAAVTAREYESSNKSSEADPRKDSSRQAFGSGLADARLLDNGDETLPTSSRFMPHRCRSIYFGFTLGETRKKPGPKGGPGMRVGWLPG